MKQLVAVQNEAFAEIEICKASPPVVEAAPATTPAPAVENVETPPA
jgi:hypothetical protein